MTRTTPPGADGVRCLLGYGQRCGLLDVVAIRGIIGSQRSAPVARADTHRRETSD